MSKFSYQHKKKFLKYFSILLFLPTLCYGESSLTTLTQGSLVEKTLQTFAMLIIVILFIFIFAYVLRKVNLMRTPNGSVIKMPSVLSLGVRERIALIEVKGVTLLVGITAQNINVLHVFPMITQEKD